MRMIHAKEVRRKYQIERKKYSVLMKMLPLPATTDTNKVAFPFYCRASLLPLVSDDLKFMRQAV